MTLTPGFRKFMLTAHVTSSIGWFGALAVFLAHALVSLNSQDEQMVQAVSLAMGITAWFVILPLSLTSLTTGLVQALGTAWGLFRHYWVLFKLALTVVATGVLLMKLGPIQYLADQATQASFSSTNHTGLQTSLVIHSVGGLVILLCAIVLAVYKPQGLTPYGFRNRRESSRELSQSRELAAHTPNWVKTIGVLMVLLLLLMAVMLVHGGHGPHSHFSHG